MTIKYLAITTLFSIFGAYYSQSYYFSRKSPDSFKIVTGQCDQVSSYHSVDKHYNCKCNHALTFIGGNRCISKLEGQKIGFGLPGSYKSFTAIEILNVTKNQSKEWIALDSKQLFTSIKTKPKSNVEKLFRGLILRFNNTFIVKIEGHGRFPLTVKRRNKLIKQTITTKPTPITTTPKSLQAGPDSNNLVGILIGVLSVAILLMLVIISLIIFKKRKTKDQNSVDANDRTEHVYQNNTVSQTPILKHNDLRRPTSFSFHSESDRYSEITHHSFSENSFQQFEPSAHLHPGYNDVNLGLPTYDIIETGENIYASADQIEPIYRELEPEYRELEPETKFSNQMYNEYTEVKYGVESNVQQIDVQPSFESIDLNEDGDVYYQPVDEGNVEQNIKNMYATVIKTP